MESRLGSVRPGLVPGSLPLYESDVGVEGHGKRFRCLWSKEIKDVRKTSQETSVCPCGHCRPSRRRRSTPGAVHSPRRVVDRSTRDSTEEAYLRTRGEQPLPLTVIWKVTGMVDTANLGTSRVSHYLFWSFTRGKDETPRVQGRVS